jgi:hypothetical protein
VRAYAEAQSCGLITVAEINAEEIPLTDRVSDYIISGPCSITIPEFVKR